MVCASVRAADARAPPRLDAAVDGSAAAGPSVEGAVADGDGQVPDTCGEVTSAAGAAVPVPAARADACSS